LVPYAHEGHKLGWVGSWQDFGNWK
jgi:hypothetical protein